MAFERFPRLPAELRLQVWEMALEPEEELRLVVFLKPRPNARHLIHGYTVPTRAPALLHVCSVSRRIGCGVYKKAFRDGDRYLWVNFDRDIIQVDCYNFKKAFPEYTEIRHLRGVCSDPHDEGARERFRIGYAISCPRLQTYDLLLDGNRAALDWWYSIFEDPAILGRLHENFRIILVKNGEYIDHSNWQLFSAWFQWRDGPESRHGETIQGYGRWDSPAERIQPWVRPTITVYELLVNRG